MEKLNKKNTAFEIDAVKEKAFTKENLLSEILPLLKENFVGIFNIKNGVIKMRFLNGQIFELTVGEVK